MNRKTWFTMVIAFVVGCGIISYHATAPTIFAAHWDFVGCSGVAGGERGLWLDTASGVADDEAGLFWIVANDAGDENCTYSTDFSHLSTTTYPTLQVKVAVNDGAKVKVEAFGPDRLGEYCESSVAAITTGSAEDNSGYLTKQVVLPPGRSICAIKITLNDDPDSVNSWRPNALFSYIRIWDGANIGWQETFTGGNP